MDSLSVVGLILVVVGVILAFPTCFLSLVLVVLGIVLIVIGESRPKAIAPPYAPYPPQYLPPQPYQQRSYPPPTNPCPTCGGPMRWVQYYNRWYCDYCRGYR